MSDPRQFDQSSNRSLPISASDEQALRKYFARWIATSTLTVDVDELLRRTLLVIRTKAYDPALSYRAWLMSNGRNVALEERLAQDRKPKTLGEIADQPGRAESSAIPATKVADVQRWMDGLDPQSRIVLIAWCEAHELNRRSRSDEQRRNGTHEHAPAALVNVYRYIGEFIGCSPGQAKKCHRRALACIRRQEVTERFNPASDSAAARENADLMREQEHMLRQARRRITRRVSPQAARASLIEFMRPMQLAHRRLTALLKGQPRSATLDNILRASPARLTKPAMKAASTDELVLNVAAFKATLIEFADATAAFATERIAGRHFSIAAICLVQDVGAILADCAVALGRNIDLEDDPMQLQADANADAEIIRDLS